MQYSYVELAKMIDHSLLNPTLTVEELESGCQLAVEYNVASVCIMPYYLRRCADILRGSTVQTSTTIGFPLINQPQVAILGVGALKKRAVVINDAIAIRPIMNISLTFDHRLIDGALGAQYLQQVAMHLESYDPNLAL